MALVLAAAVCCIAVQQGVAASTAQAFVGEGLVVKPGSPSTLTGPAETILTKPTFLPGTVAEAGAYGGAAESTGALAGASGLLGAGATALGAFGLGVGIGTLICHAVGIEGCLFSSADSADPAVETGSWVFKLPGQAVGDSPTGPGLSWYAYIGGSIASLEPGYNGAPTSGGCGETAIAGIDGFVSESEPFYTCKDSEAVKHYVPKARFYRYGMTNRSLSHVTDSQAETLESEGLVNSRVEPEDGSTEGVAAALAGQEGNAAARLGEKIASEIEGSEVENPYANLTVPSCEGLSAAACLELLEELGLTPSVAYLGWGSAVIPDVNLEEPILSLEAQAEKVQSLSPTAGTKVVEGTKVTVTANPDLEGMPLIVPEDPAPGESAESYREKRLVPMAPGWTVKEEVLGEATLDTDYNPNAVVRPVPESGTRLDPETTPKTTVQVNPSTAPPGGGGGGSCAGSYGAIDWAPLNIDVGNKFPFGVIAFFSGWIAEWETGESSPEFDVTIVNDLTIHVALGWLSGTVTYVRLAMVFATFIGFLWFLATAGMKLQGDAS